MRDAVRRLRRAFRMARYCCREAMRWSIRYRTLCPMVDLVLHYRSWLASLAPSASPLRDGKPWITIAATRALERILKPYSKVFEYGAGGSSLFFAHRVKSVVSVEHDPVWFAKVAERMAEGGLKSWEGHLVRPSPWTDALRCDPANPDHYGSTDPAFVGMSFRAYVELIDTFPDRSFDVVFIDGRARPSCLMHAIRKVAPHGVIVIDNSDREHYSQALSLAQGWFDRRDYPGLTAYDKQFTVTSILKRKPAVAPGDLPQTASHPQAACRVPSYADGSVRPEDR